MNAIKSLRKHIQEAHPDAATNISPPAHEGGSWALDVSLANKHLAIEWSPTTGFGLSNASFETFGETSDEHVQSLGDARQRVEQLLTTDAHTSPPLPILLSRLRERRGLTQQALAERLGVRQATISGMERRDDVQLSTLRRVIEALGGVLEVCGLFPDARYRLDVAAPHSQQTAPTAHVAQRTFVRAVIRDDAFDCLREAGTLARATEVAVAISTRHAVLEML